MSSEISIKVENLSKCYQIYNTPRDRLLQMLFGRNKKYYREFWALQNLSFEVKRGETVGVIGRNGSGKSTLLQLLCGTLNSTSGEILINGKVAALLELGAGFNPEFTGRENVYLNAALVGLSSAQVDECFGQIAEFADIGDFIDQPVKTYSSGMFVRLAFSVQVHTSPDIFLIDEALAVGDHRFVQKCYRKMEEIKSRGASLLLVSHDTTAIKMLCDRAIWVHDGKIASSGAASHVVDAYRNWSDKIDTTIIKASSVGPENETERLAVQRIRLLNKNNEECSGFFHASTMKIEVPIRNKMIPENTDIRMGFSVRNNRGIEIFGSNTKISGFDICIPAPEKCLLVSIVFDLPLLAAGSYSISISLDSRDASGGYATEMLMSDCVFFDIDEKIKVYTLLGVEARFSASVINTI